MSTEENNCLLLQVNEQSVIKTHFRLWNKCVIKWEILIIILAIFSCVGNLGQQLTLPIYLKTLGDNGGPYFVLWFCSFIFTLFFTIGAIFLYIKGEVTKDMMDISWQKWFILVGLCDSLNGIFMVYSSSLSKVPGPIQSILAQLMTPLTLTFSKLLLNKRKYNKKQLIGVIIIITGVIYALIPLFVHYANNDKGAIMTFKAWWWPFIMILGIIPGALMNVIQEKSQESHRLINGDSRRMSVFFLQACESFYQWIWMTIFFWFDILPNFGISNDINEFGINFKSGFRCFFSNIDINDSGICDLAPLFGTLFLLTYIVSYIFGTFMTLYATANFNSVVTTLPPILSMIFWFAAPSVNEWAGGVSYDIGSFDGVMNITSLIIILPGVYIYRKFEVDDKNIINTGKYLNAIEDIKYFPLS